ncbi:hypothetical protein EON65_15270 [archaeon]|nr:MAG: hypothetical protein EON65_15270 [archaeon]
MNSSMSYRYDVGKTLVALHACISSINLVHPQKPPSYLSILTDQIIQLVHMIDAEFSWLASGRYNDMLPFSQNYAQEKLLKNCFKRCIDIVEQGDILPSQLVVRFFRDVGPKTLELFSVWIMEGGGKDTLMEQTILTYLRYPTRGTHDRFIINAFFNRFGEESKLQFFDRNLSSKGTFIDLTVKSAQINKIMSYMAEHALDDDVWAHGDCFGVTQFDTYEAFICKLSLHMLLRYQSHYLSKQSHAKGASSTLTEQFFACALPLCLCDVRTAEMVFLYCLCHMIPQSEGAGKYVTLQLLYHHVSIHLCKSSHLKARRLACKSFVMLLQFLTDNCISMLSIVNGGCGQGTCLPNLVCVQTVIEAALGCQDTSVAWYLISFLNEMETFGSGQLITSIGCQVVGQISERLIRDAVVRKTVVDSDLLHALDVSSSLLLQGQMFASKGDFLSALSSYESMLSSNHNVKIPDVQQDIRDAVEHLGIANIARKALSQWDNIKEYDVVGYTPSLHCLSIATVESRKRLMVENVQSKALQFVQSDNMGKFCELLTFVSTRQQEMGVQTAKSTNALELSDLLVLSPSDLIRTIRSAHKSQMRKCMSVLDRLLDKLSAPQAHAISPALYSFWSDTRSSMASSTTATSDATSTIDSIHMDLQEASLLWSKGLKDSAIKLIKAAPCASLLEMVQGLEKKTVPSINSREIRLLLSDALCAAGNWMSHKGVHSIEDVVNEHLNPALDCAQQSVAQMKMDMSEAHASQLMSEDIMVASTRELSCRLAIARFFEQRFQSLNAKVTSRGWQQRQVFLEERVVEITECDRLREELSKEIRAIDSKLGAGQLHLQELRNDKERQYKNVFRHWSSLKKEVEMDSNERDSTYTTLKASLTQCIQHYLASLKLSSSLFSDLLADDSSEYVAQYAEVVDIIFRIVGLWLSSAKLRYHSDLAQEVSTLLLQELRFNKLPLQSFVLLHQQILSRLGSTLCPDKATNQTMQTVVEYFAIAMGRSYPYHVLPTLFSLLHNNVDHVSNSAKHAPADQLKSLEIGKAAASGSVDLDDRQLATRKVLMSIHKHFQEDRGSRNNSNLVVALQRLLVQYVVLAKVSTTELHEKGKIKCIKISALQEKGKRFNELVTADKLSCQVPVLTRSIPLRPLLSSQRNDWVVMLDSCMGQFDVSESGISRPKFITVVGSDGLHYRQIVKGGDDLRQDAVMQQVFENVNITLQRQRRGRSRLISLAMKTWLPEESGEVDSVDRQVYIRTYKVIPTTALTGIMEFVENTAAFGSLLCDHAPLPGAPKSSGKKGLHSRHRPQDWTNSKCQLALKNAVSDSSQKVAVMKSIYENFKPVFRYFFLENFPSPSVWYSRQCQYVNSVAVNSMIGYILGIGDRHAHNVLVDVNSGELVHIDFGIVFEQGQLLSVPETVPFRLTRDIVDGMGVLGVEGKFRKCCEYVLRSLRMHREKLMVILEVVLFDPLYKWSLSPVQMRNKQQQQVGDNEDADAFVPEEGRVAEGKADVTGSSGFDAASRALGRIQSKLRGYEEQLTSGGVALSVEDMVSLTINASMDINNLAQIFPGWRPFL